MIKRTIIFVFVIFLLFLTDSHSQISWVPLQITTWDGSSRPSGIYFYRITAGKFSETKKMMLVK